MTTLTPQREKFAQGVASGLSQAEAYRQAYPKSEKWKDAVVWKEASKLCANSKVLVRIEELRAEQRKLSLWTFEQSVETLRGIIERKTCVDKEKGVETYAAADKDVVAAIKELNAMHGFKAPEKKEITGKDGAPLMPARIEII